MDWKGTVTSVSSHVFPGLSNKLDSDLLGNKVLTNLPLQIALYFNVTFVPVWSAVVVLFVVENYFIYSELYKFIIVTVIATVFLVEVLRLYLGYEGNLRDKIPELAGFWMLSLLLQFPLQGFLLFNPHFGLYILEIVVQSVMFITLCVELISGYYALKYTAKQQAAHFRLMKLKTEGNLSDFGKQTKDVDAE